MICNVHYNNNVCCVPWMCAHNSKETRYTYIICIILTSNTDCEATTKLLHGQVHCFHVAGVCPSIMCGCRVDCQNMLIIDLPTIVPYFNTSIWTGPVVIQWCSIRQPNNPTDQEEPSSKFNCIPRRECFVVCVAIDLH